MAHRAYPSWLPPNPREREALLQLRRRQLGVILWLVAMLPAGWVILALTHSGLMLAALTIFWITLSVSFAQWIVDRSCPRCKSRFCTRREPPYWYALFNRRCDSCGLTLDARGTTDL